MGERAGRAGARRRFAVGVGLSLVVHGAAAWMLRGGRETRLIREEPPVEIVVVERTVPVEVAPPEAPTAAPEKASRPTRRPGAKARPPAAPAPATAEAAAPTGDAHSLLRMREGAVNLTPGADTLARALGPVEVPPAEEKPRRKPRLPGTGLTTLEPEIDDKVKLVHPRAFEVLTRAEKGFRPDRQRMTDEVTR